MNRLQHIAVEWCAGRSWVVRAPVLAWLVYVGMRHLFDPAYTSIFGPLNLALHEGGHLLFGYLPGDFLGVAGGTLLQLAAPVLSAVVFYRQPDYFAITVCGAWLATNLYNVAEYMADARAQELPLVTVGDGECVICHDWGYILGQLGLLSFDTTLAGLVRVFASSCGRRWPPARGCCGKWRASLFRHFIRSFFWTSVTFGPSDPRDRFPLAARSTTMVCTLPRLSKLLLS